MSETESPAEPRKPRRRAWLAALLSLFCVGLGQVYCGRLRRGLGFAALSMVLALLPGILLMLPPSLPALWSAVAAISALAAFGLFMVVDAFILARRSRASFEPQSCNRFIIYLGWFVAISVLGFGVRELRNGIAETYKVPTRSMAPSILPDERVIGNKLAYRRSGPQRGDVVVFKHYTREIGEINYIKRVVALPGDSVEVVGDEVLVNGKKLEHTSVTSPLPPKLGIRVWAEFFEETNGEAHYPIMLLTREPLASGSWPGFPDMPGRYTREPCPRTVVPDDTCFLIGDNRQMSQDSRHYGPVPMKDILGRVDYIVWPAGDWGRFGVLGH